MAVALPLVLYLYSAIQRTVLRNLIANFKIFIHGYSFVDTQPFELIPCPYKNIHSWGGWILKSSRLNSVSTYDERFWPWFTAERAITLLSFLLTPFPPLFHNFSLSLCVQGHTHLAGGTNVRAQSTAASQFVYLLSSARTSSEEEREGVNSGRKKRRRWETSIDFTEVLPFFQTITC